MVSCQLSPLLLLLLLFLILTLPSRHRGRVKFADVGTKVVPSMLTAALGVVKVKRLLEVSGHQRVMHGSGPRDGSSPVVKVRARCPGPAAATDM